MCSISSIFQPRFFRFFIFEKLNKSGLKKDPSIISTSVSTCHAHDGRKPDSKIIPTIKIFLETYFCPKRKA